METVTQGRMSLVLAGVLAALLVTPAPADAGCGCQKPPPARASVRPFVGHTDQEVTLFNEGLVRGNQYDVLFVSSADGSSDWSRGEAVMRRDLADGEKRPHLRVAVPEIALGPCAISVFHNGTPVFSLTDDAFTVTSAPIALHDISETVTRDGYRAGVGRDGTMYIAVDVSQVSGATTFSGAADGLPLRFDARSIAMYNEQGFLMQLLDPNVQGLFRLDSGVNSASNALTYWRHEFETYKREHRRIDARRRGPDVDWHNDGSYHVDHDHIVVAIAGTLLGGSQLAGGATPPFRLVVSSSPASALQ